MRHINAPRGRLGSCNFPEVENKRHKNDKIQLPRLLVFLSSHSQLHELYYVGKWQRLNMHQAGFYSDLLAIDSDKSMILKLKEADF